MIGLYRRTKTNMYTRNIWLSATGRPNSAGLARFLMLFEDYFRFPLLKVRSGLTQCFKPGWATQNTP